ncbi:membrane protein [Roseivivax halodurans JCM 10272]|uniref:Membrane protein n=1 Tax=Roseivivax halodurans JCM 10272 TaxID=1449350 RepID=X7EKU3_9RHOB|nr:membrane protein [Roseivivax halodurans JCM 10272]
MDAKPLHIEDLHRVERLERLAAQMDSAFRIPGTKIRFGWDGILSIVPGVGDTIALIPAAHIFHSAYKMGVPSHTIGRMAFNSGIDYVIGSIPVIGTVFDVGYKSNRKNAALIREHVEKKHGGRLAPERGAFV